jgi:hypothetical protein
MDKRGLLQTVATEFYYVDIVCNSDRIAAEIWQVKFVAFRPNPETWDSLVLDKDNAGRSFTVQ